MWVPAYLLLYRTTNRIKITASITKISGMVTANKTAKGKKTNEETEIIILVIHHIFILTDGKDMAYENQNSVEAPAVHKLFCVTRDADFKIGIARMNLPISIWLYSTNMNFFLFLHFENEIDTGT